MPILKEKAHLYGEDWPEFAATIKWDRAGGRCECDGRCGDPHCRGLTEGRCNAEHGQPHPVNGKRTVMTVAHLTHDETCRDPELVGAYCARCHIIFDRHHHAATRQRRAEERKAADRAKVLTTTAMLAFAVECRTGARVAR